MKICFQKKVIPFLIHKDIKREKNLNSSFTAKVISYDKERKD